MKSSIGTLALRFAAMVVLLAPAVSAQAQGIAHSPSTAERASTRMSPAPSGAHATPPQPDRRPSSETASRMPPTTSSPSPRSSTLGQTNGSPSRTRGESRMQEGRTNGSVPATSSPETSSPETSSPETSSSEGLGRDRNWRSVHVRNYYYLPPPSASPSPTEPPVTRTTPSSETVSYDPVAEAGKAQVRATEHRDPPSLSLCPPPYRMTARDGCQR
jgi:hypothetical protein